MKQEKKMPHLSEMLGMGVRKNSESMLAVKPFRMNGVDHTYGDAISSSVFPDEHTHIEPCRFSKHSGAIQALGGVITDGGGRIPRQLRFVINMIKHPLHFLNLINPYHAAERGICLLVMQDYDNSINIQRKRRLIWPFVKSLTSKQSEDKKIPTYIPIANNFARKLAKKVKGSAYSTINEIMLNAPTTAHILSGCPMGETADTRVIDLQNRVFGYENIYVIDGSMIPTNLGVNPSLAISAFAERANSFIPSKKGKDFRFLKVEKKWEVRELLVPGK